MSVCALCSRWLLFQNAQAGQVCLKGSQQQGCYSGTQPRVLLNLELALTSLRAFQRLPGIAESYVAGSPILRFEHLRKHSNSKAHALLHRLSGVSSQSWISVTSQGMVAEAQTLPLHYCLGSKPSSALALWCCLAHGDILLSLFFFSPVSNQTSFGSSFPLPHSQTQ